MTQDEFSRLLSAIEARKSNFADSLQRANRILGHLWQGAGVNVYNHDSSLEQHSPWRCASEMHLTTSVAQGECEDMRQPETIDPCILRLDRSREDRKVESDVDLFAEWTCDDSIGAPQSDVREEMQQAEQYILSTAEVVDEVYDDCATDGSNQARKGKEEYNHGGLRKRHSTTTGDPQSSTIVVLPCPETEVSEPSPMDGPVLVGSPESLSANDNQGQPKNSNSCRNDKRRAVHDASDLLCTALAGIETNGFDAVPDGIAIDPDRAQHIDPPSMSFPSPLVDPPQTDDIATGANLRANATASSELATETSPRGGIHNYFPLTNASAESCDSVSIPPHYSEAGSIFKKRKFSNQPDDIDAQLRSIESQKRTQIKDWEPFKETVDSIRRIWSDLDHARIYVTSPLELEELAAQRHPFHRRLWSWSKEDKEGFDHQIGRLLRDRKFGFQAVSSDAHTRQYCSLEHMKFWNAYFEETECRYWLAVLTQWRPPASSRQKVRKAFDARK